MSHTLSSLIDCPTIQDRLNNHFITCDPTTLREPIPFVEFLTSSANTSGVIQGQITPGKGKLKTIELVYEPRYRESEASTSAVQSCTATEEGGQLSETYEIDPAVGTSHSQKFTLTNLATICEADEQYIARQIQKSIDVCIRKMASTTMGQVPALVGDFGPGVTPNGSNELVVATQKSNGDIDTDFIEQIAFATMDAGYCTIPYIFGYDEIHKAFRRVKAGCCSTSGLHVGEFAQQEGMAFFTDYRVNTTFGANHFFSVQPGAIQLLTYNEYMGPQGVRVIDTETYKQTVVRDPATGIPFDIMWRFDCGVIHMQVKLAHKLIGMPTDMFFDGDRLRGVTFVNEYLITNP
jgi:hypothetical protein